jgi:hypothetical protein
MTNTQASPRSAAKRTSGLGAARGGAKGAEKKGANMDVREWIGGTFLKLEDMGATPIVLTIVDIAEGKYDKPDLTFNDGSKLSLNKTNGRAIVRAWGYETDDWIGQQVELSVGLTTYNGEEQKSILLVPITRATPANAGRLLKPSKLTRMSEPPDDDIPF